MERAHLVGYCLAVSRASKATGLGEILLGISFPIQKTRSLNSQVLQARFFLAILLLCYYSLYLGVFHCHLC